MRRCDSSRISGCSRASSALLAAGSEKTRSRIFFRSMAPDAAMNSAPNSLSSCGNAAPPGSVSSRAMASVSTTVAPRRANSSAAALLPLPMPPVSPTGNLRERLKGGGSQPLGIPAKDGLAPEERDQRGDRDVGSEVEAESCVPAAARGEHLQRAEREAHEGRQQDHERQQLPA